jgi:hypothetical protein
MGERNLPKHLVKLENEKDYKKAEWLELCLLEFLEINFDDLIIYDDLFEDIKGNEDSEDSERIVEELLQKYLDNHSDLNIEDVLRKYNFIYSKIYLTREEWLMFEPILYESHCFLYTSNNLKKCSGIMYEDRKLSNTIYLIFLKEPKILKYECLSCYYEFFWKS